MQPSFYNAINLLKKMDWLLIIAVFLISLLSLTTLYHLGKDIHTFSFSKQLFYVAAGFFLLLAMSLIDYLIFRNYPIFLLFIYAAAVVLLIAVLFFGEKIRGTTGWFVFGGFNFAPVEFAKLAIVILLAKYFSIRHIELYKLRHLVASGVYVALPVLLVLVQPDFGSAIILAAIWLGMVIVSGIRLRQLVIIILIGALLCGVMWVGFLEDYQKKRVLTFLNPQRDPLGYSYNLRQSIIAIGSGGFWGKGIGKGTQSHLGFLPESNTDFIFATVAEERGFVGVLGLFFLYGFLIYRILKISFIAENNFSRLFAVGLVAMFSFQIFINIGMNLGLVPVVGIPLPLLSYGGSAAIMNFLGLGILQSIKVRS